MFEITWNNPQNLPSQSYTCGHCGTRVASEKGWTAVNPRLGRHTCWIYICHLCQGPTFFSTDDPVTQVPGVVFGNSVPEITDQSLANLYAEARRATGARSYTAAVMCCRKLLMHLAVAKGAPVGEPFIKYVEFLSANNYVPPDAKGWVDHIRQKGNEANHEITIMKQEDAEELISFVEMLLKLMYEFPAIIKKKAQPKPAP